METATASSHYGVLATFFTFFTPFTPPLPSNLYHLPPTSTTFLHRHQYLLPSLHPFISSAQTSSSSPALFLFLVSCLRRRFRVRRLASLRMLACSVDVGSHSPLPTPLSSSTHSCHASRACLARGVLDVMPVGKPMACSQC